jgi:hypothetical protein
MDEQLTVEFGAFVDLIEWNTETRKKGRGLRENPFFITPGPNPSEPCKKKKDSQTRAGVGEVIW